MPSRTSLFRAWRRTRISQIRPIHIRAQLLAAHLAEALALNIDYKEITNPRLC